ncbi:MAG: DUF5818 domain-containing protein [Oceanicaulis sp.]
MSFRTLFACGAVFAAGGAGLPMTAAPANAQTQCGARYAIEYGDTLYQIAQQCRVSMDAIVRLNPELDPRALEVGQVIALDDSAPGRGAGSDPDRDRRTDGYRVQSGDTPYSIAERLGLSLFELLAANTDIDADALPVGEVLNVPDRDRPQSAIDVTPLEGGPETEVTIEAYNLRPNSWVTVGAGVYESEWSRVREARTDSNGDLSVSLETPDWADPGDDLIFVVDTDWGVTLRSDVFDVVDPDTGRDSQDRVYAFEGRVREGAECYTLEAEDGNEYALVSGDVRFTAGEYVRVEGRRADASFCQEGAFTLDVGLIEEVDQSRDGRDEDRSPGMLALEGRVRQGVECYTLTTPQGDLYSLVSNDVSFTDGEYVEIEGSRAAMSFCQQGEATIDVDQIREVGR